MARDPHFVWIRLERIHCYDEADSWGTAEPYLWTVFFKVDGSGVHITDDYTLIGQPVVEPTPGSHGNLGDSEVDAGDDVAIPSAIGEWKTLLRPIEFPPDRQFLGDKPGVVGVVCILMEQDNVTDAGAEAGHRALNDATRAALEQIVATRDINHSEVTPEETKQFTEGIADAVKAGVKAQQTFFQNAWSWLNADDQIGSEVFVWTQEELTKEPTPFSKRWKHEGDWEIFGHISGTPSHLLGILESVTPHLEAAVKDAAPGLQEFHEQGPAGTSLGAWRILVARNGPEFVHSLQQDSSAADTAADLVRELPKLLNRQDEQLPDKFLDRLSDVLEAVRKHGGRQARRDADLVRDVLPELRGMTAGQALAALSSCAPAKRSGKQSLQRT